MRDTPEPPAPTPSATTCAACGKPKSEHIHERSRWFCYEFVDGMMGEDAAAEFVPPASAPACATVPNDSTCPCGTALVRDGEVVHSHWTGSICSECEQAIIEKYNARMREAHRD